MTTVGAFTVRVHFYDRVHNIRFTQPRVSRVSTAGVFRKEACAVRESRSIFLNRSADIHCNALNHFAAITDDEIS